MSNFHPLEVVGRGSETQLQLGENLNKLTLALIDQINVIGNELCVQTSRFANICAQIKPI